MLGQVSLEGSPERSWEPAPSLPQLCHLARPILGAELGVLDPIGAPLPSRYQPPNLAISTLYWKAWPLLLVVAAFNPENIGEPLLAAAGTRMALLVLLLGQFVCWDLG